MTPFALLPPLRALPYRLLYAANGVRAAGRGTRRGLPHRTPVGARIINSASADAAAAPPTAGSGRRAAASWHVNPVKLT